MFLHRRNFYSLIIILQAMWISGQVVTYMYFKKTLNAMMAVLD